jgi:hypothetical protein
MPLIPPIGDAYIDEIIKAVDPFDASLNKTQGVKLRELIKLMRDRMEQQSAMAVATQRTYTEIGNSDVSVSPATYFDQPTTFIVNRNSGSDAIISFQNYASEDDKGKVYHIKNMGLKPAVVISASGALFDGEASITLNQYSAVTIMSVNLTMDGGTLSKWAIMSSKGQSTDQVYKVLTLNVVGLPGNIAVSVNDTVWPGRQKSLPVGTVLQNLVVTAAGYTISPSSIPSVTVDEDKTLNFTATATGDDPVLTIVVNGIADGYEVAVNNVVWIDNKKTFPIGTVLENLRVRVEDYDIDPTVIDQVIMDSDKTLTFDATSQGFSHLDDEWEDENGGYLDSNVTRTGNSLFIVPSSTTSHYAYAGATLALGDMEPASLKFELHEGMIGVLKSTESIGGQNNFAYGVKTDGAQIIATTWLGDPANDNYITLAGHTHPIIIEMEFTPTEVVWHHGDGVDRLEWFRYERFDFDYYVGAEVYTSIENIKQKGFTTVDPGEDTLIDAFNNIDFTDAVNAGGTRTVTESPTGVWTSDSSVSDNPLQTRFRFNADSILALRGNSIGIKLGLAEGFDNLFNLKVSITVDDSGVFMYETVGGSVNLTNQPTDDQFVGMRYAGSNDFEFGIIDINGVFTLSDTIDIGYDLVGDFTAVVQAKFNEGPASKFYYPQGKNLELVSNYILLSGATRLVPTNTHWTADVYGYTRDIEGYDEATEVLVGDGFIAIQMQTDASGGVYIGTTGLTDFIGVNVISGVANRQDPGPVNTPFDPQPEIGQYFGMRRTGETIDAVIWSDPDTTTVEYIWSGDKSDFEVIAYEGLDPNNKIYDPQYNTSTEPPTTLMAKIMFNADGQTRTDTNWNTVAQISTDAALIDQNGDSLPWTMTIPSLDDWDIDPVASNSGSADFSAVSLERVVYTLAPGTSKIVTIDNLNASKVYKIQVAALTGYDDPAGDNKTNVIINGVSKELSMALGFTPYVVTFEDLTGSTSIDIEITTATGATYAMASAMIIEEVGDATDDVLLSGATRFTPPVEWVNTPNADSAYRYEWTTGGARIAGKQLIGEGYVAVRFETDSNIMLYLCIDNNTAYATYIGVRTGVDIGDEVRWEDNTYGSGATAIQPTLGEYIGIRRLSDDSLVLFSTVDGTSFTTLHTFGAASQPFSDFKYLVFETAGSGYMYDPQTIGLTNT